MSFWLKPISNAWHFILFNWFGQKTHANCSPMLLVMRRREVIKLVWPFMILLLPIRWKIAIILTPRQECGTWMLKIFYCFLRTSVLFSILKIARVVFFDSCCPHIISLDLPRVMTAVSFHSIPLSWHTTYITNRASKHKLVSHTDFKMQRVKEMWP